jgi:chromosomal replication initiation ATPase DnaA
MEWQFNKNEMVHPCHYIGFIRVRTYLVRANKSKPASLKGEKIKYPEQEIAISIAKEVFASLGVDGRNMRLKVKVEEVVEAKRISIYLLRTHTKLDDKTIAPMFGLDRSTVCYHFKKCKDLISVDKKLKNLIENIETVLKLRRPAPE